MSNRALAELIAAAGRGEPVMWPDRPARTKRPPNRIITTPHKYTAAEWQPLFDDIKDFWRENLHGPSVRDICEMAGYSTTSAGHHAIRCMELLGMVRCNGGRARSIVPVGMRVVFDDDAGDEV